MHDVLLKMPEIFSASGLPTCSKRSKFLSTASRPQLPSAIVSVSSSSPCNPTASDNELLWLAIVTAPTPSSELAECCSTKSGRSTKGCPTLTCLQDPTQVRRRLRATTIGSSWPQSHTGEFWLVRWWLHHPRRITRFAMPLCALCPRGTGRTYSIVVCMHCVWASTYLLSNS